MHDFDKNGFTNNREVWRFQKLHEKKTYTWPLLIGCFENGFCSLEYFHSFNFGQAESSLNTFMYQSNQDNHNKPIILAYVMRISLIWQFIHFYLFDYHPLQIQETNGSLNILCLELALDLFLENLIREVYCSSPQKFL